MREDLISWKVESEDDYAKHMGMVRMIYKDKNMRNKIDVSEAVEVFDVK